MKIKKKKVADINIRNTEMTSVSKLL